jgi:hypothetical protein
MKLCALVTRLASIDPHGRRRGGGQLLVERVEQVGATVDHDRPLVADDAPVEGIVEDVEVLVHLEGALRCPGVKWCGLSTASAPAARPAPRRGEAPP